MLRDRGELETNLREAIERIKYNKKNIQEVNKSLSQFDIPRGTFNAIAKNDSVIQEIDLGLLYLVTDAVFKIDSSDDIRPENFFTTGEIDAGKEYRVERTDNVELPITLNNVLQLDHENYLTIIKVVDLVKWFHSKLITYDFETQRSPVFKRGKNGVVPVPQVNQKSVDSIYEHMLEETYLPDVLTLNVFDIEDEPIIYNPKTKVFTIKENATISILDGFHRLQGAVKAFSQNPELSLTMGLAIKVFDTDMAKKYFGQINTINIVRQERLDELKQEKIAYVAVKHLQMNSDLKGRIASGSKVSELAAHLTTADILANSIEEAFEPRNTYEAREAGNFLADFFNYLLGMFPEKFKTRDDMLSHPRMFVGYVILAKQFKDNNIPLDKIKDVVNWLMQHKRAEIKQALSSSKGSSSSRLQKTVREYFEKIDVKEILK